MQICSATIGFAIEERYLVKSCKRANVMEQHACLRGFLRKDITTDEHALQSQIILDNPVD